MGANFMSLIINLLTSFLTGIAPLFGSTFQTIFLIESDPVGAAGVYDAASPIAELALMFIAMAIGYKIIGWVFGLLKKAWTKLGSGKRRRA